jgi:hypothetical protein
MAAESNPPVALATGSLPGTEAIPLDAARALFEAGSAVALLLTAFKDPCGTSPRVPLLDNAIERAAADNALPVPSERDILPLLEAARDVSPLIIGGLGGSVGAAPKFPERDEDESGPFEAPCCSMDREIVAASNVHETIWLRAMGKPDAESAEPGSVSVESAKTAVSSTPTASSFAASGAGVRATSDPALAPRWRASVDS